MKFWPTFLVVVFCVSGLPAAAADIPDAFALQGDVDHVWTATAAALVFLMQAGFLLLEAGSVRSKNSVNVAQKNLMDFVISTISFGALGYMLMFGTSVGGWIGWQPELLAFGSTGDWSLTFFVFQLMFCGTAATVMSGAVAERMTINGYLLGALLIATVIYPVAGHWAWGGLLNGSDAPILASYGFMDFAGSTVVHSVGAWVALAAIIVIGPRIGKFDENGKPRTLHGHSPVLATLGAIILWIGWIGFNGGSLLSGTRDFASVIVNTVIAGGAGGASLMIIGRLAKGIFKPDATINGLLGGLVAITAGADVMTPQTSFMIGALGGVVVFASTYLLETVLKLDDPLGAVPVHGFAGVFGTLAVALFAPEDVLLAGSRANQIAVQIGGAALFFVWAFGVSYTVFKLVDMLLKSSPDGGNGLRVPENHELEGLNAHEHDAPMGTGILQEAMAHVARNFDGGLQKIELDYGDEAYETSVLYNRIIDNIQAQRAEEEEKYQTAKAKRLAVEAEVAEVVKACVNGDFSKRLATEGRKDFLLELSKGINALCDTTEDAMKSIERSLNAVSVGDLSRSMDGEYGGQLLNIKAAMNRTLDTLTVVSNDVHRTVSAASEGNFSLPIDLHQKEGFFKDLCESVNDLCSISERGLSELFDTLNQIGGGDLTASMSDQYQGQFAEIGASVSRMSQGISDLLSSVEQTALKVVAEGKSIADSEQAVVARSQQQADALNSMSSSVSSLVEASKTAAKQAKLSDTLCTKAHQSADTGQKLAQDLSIQIGEINTSTDEILTALGLIEDISMQTNLLSLNASVEAVRGRGSGDVEGFKVVAQEIRSLAHRSADAAKSIREMTDRVRNSVAEGVDLVDKTNEVLNDINNAIAQSADCATQLSDIGSKQSALSEAIETETSTITNNASDNFKAAQQNSHVTLSLVDSAEETIEKISYFKRPGDDERLAA